MSEKRETILRMIIVWSISLILSISAMGVSVYVLTRDRIDYSCERSGHSFEARYDTEPPAPETISILNLSIESNKLKAVGSMSKKLYVCDVCRYCGNSVRRQTK